jgi:S-adenosyl-L-methionine hydrolase (adenosine-forming)
VSPGARPIVFLSDYGLQDEFVGICHAVMARISPESAVIHLTHSIPPQAVLRGALTLHRAIHYLPAEAVVMAVVDPGVGTPRTPVAVETVRHGRVLIGPDNGLLSLAWAEEEGVARAVEISSPDVVLEPVSRTFHGRDVFAPAAARVAQGWPVERLGPPLDPASLTALSLPRAVADSGSVDAEVLSVDRFGNVQLSARVEDLAAAGLDELPDLELQAGEWSTRVRRVATFADVVEGEFGLIVDSSRWLGVVINRGSAAEAFSLTPGDPVTLRRPASPR